MSALWHAVSKGLWHSVKYKDVYLKGYANAMELMIGLAEYFVFYNGERPHQSTGQPNTRRGVRHGQRG